ncbi:UbiD family decarboxylase [bacterium]|nr:UbiD family decarboxylase [bacterium]
MGYPNLREGVEDLERHGKLVRIDIPIDPHLEAAEIHRRVQQAKGPALLFTQLKGTSFPAVSNLFGTMERTEFIFRDTVESVRRLVELKVDPSSLARRPWRYVSAPLRALSMLPRLVRTGPILSRTISLSELPKITCWPKDGGAFVTLPQVYTEDPVQPGFARSNLGMYRVQLDGNDYARDREVGLHYQLHRGIGVHHSRAIERGERLRVVVSVGGPPSLAVSAVMPLPEGMSELGFAGVLSGRRLRLVAGPNGLPIPAEADFAIVGTIDPSRRLPEGPFGDHLGYYALTHDFPVLDVEKVYARPGAIWPFTVVGRPPQEDTSFGEFIHALTGPIIPTVLPGIHAVHAVDAAGVHPLLLAIGSERYVPYESNRQPRELLTGANAILGQGQLSLAKFLWIAAREDNPTLDIHDIEAFFRHILERIDWSRDLHFQTSTTIDTLDYSGTALNEGSKLVIAAAGPRKRELPTVLPSDIPLPTGFSKPALCFPGVVAIDGPKFQSHSDDIEPAIARLSEELGPDHPLSSFPLLVVVDDSSFTARTLSNFLWVTFTRANPAADVHGAGGKVWRKHFGCRNPLIIDARMKPHHSPPVLEDPAVTKRIDQWAAPGGPLHGIVP